VRRSPQRNLKVAAAQREVEPGFGLSYDRGMKNDPHLRELHEKRSFLAEFLEPLENGRLVGVDTPAIEARMHFLRRQIADLDAIIAREESLG
jgi:hypothetical protein